MPLREPDANCSGNGRRILTIESSKTEIKLDETLYIDLAIYISEPLKIKKNS